MTAEADEGKVAPTWAATELSDVTASNAMYRLTFGKSIRGYSAMPELGGPGQITELLHRVHAGDQWVVRAGTWLTRAVLVGSHRPRLLRATTLVGISEHQSVREIHHSRLGCVGKQT